MATFNRNAAFTGKLRQALGTSSLAMASHAASLIRRGFTRGGRGTPSAVGTAPNVQTGLLRNSINARMDGVASATVRTAARYATIHEFGGTIRSRGKAMPVPLNYNAQVLLQRAGPGGLRAAMPNGYISKTRDGTVILRAMGPTATQRGYKGTMPVISRDTPAFVLRRSIRISARPFFFPPIRNNRGAIMAAGNAAFSNAMKGSG